MICPNCHKPYFFLPRNDTRTAVCERCQYIAPLQMPSYDAYHHQRYVTKPYRRTEATDPQMKKIFRALAIQPDKQILDVGCGVGDYTVAGAKYSTQIIGMDQDITAARKKYPQCTFQQHDANQKLPFANETLDVILAINVIEHLVHFDQFLKECHRVLRPGGRIAITTANRSFVLHDFFYDPTHLHEWTLPQFKQLLEPFFELSVSEKSSSMFNYYPLNFITTTFLKPDLLFMGTKT